MFRPLLWHGVCRERHWLLPVPAYRSLKQAGSSLRYLPPPNGVDVTNLGFHAEQHPADDRWSHAKLYLLRRGTSRRVLLTSANFSQAAWGMEKSDGELTIENFELGVCIEQAIWPFEHLEQFPSDVTPATVLVVPSFRIPNISWARANWNGKKVSVSFRCEPPDTLISIFNSPFGPEVLVVTDKLSEGIDLHRYCRRLIHYELDPSPIRTVQRNGRLRRVNSWSAVTGKPILYAYPAFRGTRDQKLVQVMKKRIDGFSLLLGGVQGFDVEDLPESEEQWRNEVIAIAKTRLESAGGRLRAMDPAEETPFKNGSYEREFAATSSS
jgi:hypothetical protein